MAALNNSNQITDSTATLGILIGVTSNMLIKAPIAFSLGSRAFAVRLAIGVTLLLAGLWLPYGVAVFVHGP
jgi:uncharacterized membrane protein (DUF4010 family)